MKYFLIAISLLTLISCGKSTVKLRINDIEVTAEIARTTEERETGLMFRDNLKENHGMLFVFPEEQFLSFWMKNTYIPLSIAFINEKGIIKEIYSMKPKSLRAIQSRFAVKYALELPEGNFERIGIKIGDSISIPEGY